MLNCCLITNECIDHSAKVKKAGIVRHIDMEKAYYDHVI